MCTDVDRCLERRCRGRPGLLQSVPHVLVNDSGLPRAPDKAAAEEDRKKKHAIVPLGPAAGHIHFVEEPVDIEEGTGELIENEDWRVVVDKRSLKADATYKP